MTTLTEIQAAQAASNAMDNAPANAGSNNPTPTLQATLLALGETMGEWKPYDSQLPLTDIAGTRITKALYKTNKATGTIAGTNAYTRIPTKHLNVATVTANIAKIAPLVVDWLQGIESDMLKEEHKKGQLNIFTDGLTLDRIIAKLEEGSDNSRLTKVDIENWYDKSISENLALLFADKMGLDENSSEQELNKLEKVMAAYKAKFASLASPKVFMVESDTLAMINVIKNCEPEEADRSVLGSRFIIKLEKMNEKDEDLLFSL